MRSVKNLDVTIYALVMGLAGINEIGEIQEGGKEKKIKRETWSVIIGWDNI